MRGLVQANIQFKTQGLAMLVFQFKREAQSEPYLQSNVEFVSPHFSSNMELGHVYISMKMWVSSSHFKQ